MTEVAFRPLPLALSESTLAEARRSLRDTSSMHSTTSSSSKNYCPNYYVGETKTEASSVPPSASSPVKQDDKELLAVQEVLAALSFSPRSVLDLPSTTTETTAKGKSTVGSFGSFDSPPPKKKFIITSKGKSSVGTGTSTSHSTPVTTPWIRPQQSTPPTAKLEEEEEEEEEEESVATPSLERNNETASEASPATAPESQPTTHSSPVRKCNFRSSISSSSSAAAEAVAMAYPLCLPAEHMRKSGAYTLITTTTNAPATTTTTNSTKANNHPQKPRSKRFPPVDTSIPGVGVQRSSAGLAHKSKDKFSPFALIATNDNDGSTVTTKRYRSSKQHNQNHNNQHPRVAHQLYEQVKGAWAWSKDHAKVVSPVMNVAEGVVSKVADIATGNGDLEHVDHNVVEPIVSALDQHIFNPVVGTVGGIWNGFFGIGAGRKKESEEK